MLLNELFNAQVDVKLVQTKQGYDASFVTQSGNEYLVEFHNEVPNYNSFTEKLKRFFGKQPNNTWSMAFKQVQEKGGSYGVTGAGSEIEVFSAVLSITSTFIDKFHPYMLWFSGNKEDNHSRLYSKMLRFLGRKIANKGYVAGENELDNVTVFALTKE